MKKLLSLALALALCLSLTIPAYAADSDFVIENGVLTKYNGPGGAVTIPDSVTTIGLWAFYHCTELTSVVIPSSVTSIETLAFAGCSGLTSVVIPDSVTSIESGAFDACSSLTSVVIPDSVTNMGLGLFDSCYGLTSAGPIGSGCDYQFGWTETIPAYAFSGCSGLTSITIPSSVKSIGGYAFNGCRSLTSVVVPSGVTKIDGGVFFDCSGLTSVVIPSGVTSIGWGAFNRCSGLTSITIPSSVTVIDDVAFANCSGLTSIVIPSSVSIIGFTTFVGCNSLTDVYYTGTKSQWDKTDIHKDNEPLLNANFHYEADGSNLMPSGNANGSASDSNSSSSNNSSSNSSGSSSSSGSTGTTHNTGGTTSAPFTEVPIATPIQPSVPASPTKFTDVSASSPFVDAINWAVEKNITTGKTSTTFAPGEQCTNGQILTFLWRANGSPEPTVDNPFTDSIPASFQKAAVWAYEKGLVSGAVFGASTPCTRAVTVEYLWKAAGSPATSGSASFADVPANADYAQAVAWAVANGVTSGTGNGQFSPANTCTRGQIVTFLYRAMGK